MDTGTKYLRKQLLTQYEDITPSLISEMFPQIVIYRSFNKVETFTKYGGIPKSHERREFRRFIVTEMEEGHKPFTAAHQVQGLQKVTESMNHVLKHKEEMARRLRSSSSLEKSCMIIKEVPHLGDFNSWQIMCDLTEIGLLKYPEDSFVMLGPGAYKGLGNVLNESAKAKPMENTKLLTKFMPQVFKRLKLPFKNFLGRPLGLKAVEHVLCEYSKYQNACANGISKRKYQQSTKKDTHKKCCLCDSSCPQVEVDRVWLLCKRCYNLESSQKVLFVSKYKNSHGKSFELKKVKIKTSKALIS